MYVDKIRRDDDNTGNVTGVSLTNARERPEAEISRRAINSALFHSIPLSVRSFDNSGEGDEKVASITDFRLLSDIAFVSALSPRSSDKASSMIDLPAPVSPVTIVSPGVNLRFRSSINA